MPGPGEPDPVASGMRGGCNSDESDLDGESGESRMKPTDRSAGDYDLRRPGPQRHPPPDAGGTHEEGHDIPHIPSPEPRPDHGKYLHGDTGRYTENEYIPPPNFRPEHSDYRRGPPGHYFYSPPPPMPMPTSAPTVPRGWFRLTKRQKLREDESRSSRTLILLYTELLLTRDTVLQTLSKRLEHDIKDMMISNGDTKKARKRRDLQEPLRKARQDVLKEQLLREELFEEQKVRAETERAEAKAQDLRSKRESRLPGERVIINDWLDSEDEYYSFLRSYWGPGPDELRTAPEQGQPEFYRRFGFEDAHLHPRQPDPDEVEINHGRDRPESRRRQPVQEDRWKLRARERQMASDEERLRKLQHEFVLERKGVGEEKRRPRSVFIDERHGSGADKLRYVPRPHPEPGGLKLDPDADRLGRERRQREEEERLFRERQTGSDQKLRTRQPESETKWQRFEEEKRPHADDKVKGKRRVSRREGQSEEDGIKRPDYHHFRRKPDRSARNEEQSGREREHQRQRDEDDRAKRDRLRHVHNARLLEEPQHWRQRSGKWSLF
jgi:hypothetical protein